MNYESSENVDKSNVKILLSTYNGENFLEKLLDSLLNQDYSSYNIVIRDDGSSDNTISIIKKYKLKHPEIIEILEANPGINLGVKKSFELLLSLSEGDYYFFCDQDDIWKPDKISKLVNNLQSEERKSPELPLLALSDFRIFNDKKIVLDSYYKKVNFNSSDLKNKLFICLIPGCCFGFNKKAKELYFKYSTEYLHDGHLFLLIQFFGKIITDDNKLIDYRIHANNVVGYWKNSEKTWLIKDFIKFLNDKESYRKLLLEDYFTNAKLLYGQIDGNLLKRNEFYLLKELESLSLFSRKKWYIKHFKPFKKGLFQGTMEILTF